MKTKDIFQILKNEIHSTVFAVVDKNGQPKTCVIDIMLCDDNSLYFITAKGKKFYERLMDKQYVAISGMKGKDTLSTIAISVCGQVRNIGNELLPLIFKENSYMSEIYKSEDSRSVLTVFQLYSGEGEFFDLSQIPPVREAFSFGGTAITDMGYFINDKCIGCGNCIKKCPIECIKPNGRQFRINSENCIRCGNCFESCQLGAVEKR